jgi:hypothetical protein
MPNILIVVIVILFFMYFVLASIFIGEYVFYTSVRSTGFGVASAFNDIIRPLGFLYTFMNGFRQYLADPSLEAYGQSAFDFLMLASEKSILYIKNIENFKSVLSGVVDPVQYSIIESRLIDNICPEVNYFASIEECESFAEGLTKQGVIVLISYYMSSMMNLLREYTDGRISKEDCLNSRELFEMCIVFL